MIQIKKYPSRRTLIFQSQRENIKFYYTCTKNLYFRGQYFLNMKSTNVI
jgi:hypothetical protein